MERPGSGLWFPWGTQQNRLRESVCVCVGGVSEERPSHFITCYTANWDIKSAGAPRKRGAPSSSQDALWTTDSGLYVCPDPSSATRDVLAP